MTTQRFRYLLIPLVVGVLAGHAIAAPDLEAKAVADLLRAKSPGDRVEPTTDDLSRLLETPDADPWLLVEHLLTSGRQDVATSLARLTKPEATGPLLTYAEAKIAVEDRARRLAALDDARAALEANAPDDAMRHIDLARAGAAATTITGLRAAQLLAKTHAAARRTDEAIVAWLRAGEDALRVGWWAGAEQSFRAGIPSALEVQNLDLLSQAMEGLRDVNELRGDAPALASTEHDLGAISHWRGDLPGAVRHYEAAAGIYAELDQHVDLADAMSLGSLVHAELGDVRSALQDQAELAQHFEGRPRDEAWAYNQMRLGLIHRLVGDEPAMTACIRSALDTFREVGSKDGEAAALGNLGLAHSLGGRTDEALRSYEAALALSAAAGNAMHVAAAKNNIADALLHIGADEMERAANTADVEARKALFKQAETTLNRAAALVGEVSEYADGAGASSMACVARHTRGQILLAAGQLDVAAAVLETARNDASRLGAVQTELSVTVTLARTRLRQKKWTEAIAEARRAVAGIWASSGGLAEGDAERVRRLTPDVFDIGVTASWFAESGNDMGYFMEAGRARALLRGLGGRSTALGAAVSRDLVARRDEASRAKVAAFGEWQRATIRPEAREARKRYLAQRAVEADAIEAVRDAQSEAAHRLAPSRPVSLLELQSRLRRTARPGLRQVFLLFNLQKERGYVLRVEPSSISAHVYAADTMAQLRDALGSIAAARDGALDLAALNAVKRLLIDPLEIPSGPTRLFVCPDRELAYVPLATVLPDDWEIAWEPSATTYELLTKRRLRKGQGILGVGDPDYRTGATGRVARHRGPPLLPLPATRAEIESIASGSDDRRLLGPEATELGLREVLQAKRRGHVWKSVHFACHGLVDVESPAFSSLALTPGDGEDGLLTSAEILGLDLRTDLAILSACQTGRGQYVRGEGILSLTRAFMFAGAPRLIVSLWDVDDAATAHLMDVFYREWNSGRSTAKALRLAQQAVRDHEAPTEDGTPHRPWADPKFWGAWMLWGLAD